MKKDTLVTAAGRDPKSNFGVVNPPVYHASTITFRTLEEFESRNAAPHGQIPQYGRSGTPTQFAFEEAITAMHGGYNTVAYPSGMAALTGATMAFLKNGDHMLMADSVYGPSRTRIADTIMVRSGVETTFFDPSIGSEIAGLIRPETKVIFMESPGSLTFEMIDVPAICTVAKDKRILTIIDNTWSSPYFCQPISLGVDVVCEASTKYIVGHSDVMMGTVTASNDEQFQQLKGIANGLGYHAAPDDCYLALRGLRTIAVRLPRHQKNALIVANWLQSRSEIAEVRYPALPDAQGHGIWRRDHSGASGLFSVIMAEGDWTAGAALINGLERFGLGASWGGYESLVLPAHPEKVRSAIPWPHKTPMLRFHIGLEDTDDLITDLEAGLVRYASAC